MKIHSKFLSKPNITSKLLALMGLVFLFNFCIVKSKGLSGLPKGDADNGGLFLPGGL